MPPASHVSQAGGDSFPFATTARAHSQGDARLEQRRVRRALYRTSGSHSQSGRDVAVRQSEPRHVPHEAKRKDLEFLRELIEAGELKPVIDRTYSLSEAPEAIRYLEGGHAQGKVAITV